MKVPGETVRLLTSPKEEFSYLTGMTLKGINIKCRDSDYMLIVKAVSRKGDHLVAFVSSTELLDCWQYLADCLNKNTAALVWRADKWK